MLELLPIVGVVLILWLLIIRPQSRRNRELAEMQRSLNVGDEVMLTSGVYGVLIALEDDVAQVEIAESVTIRVARGAIGTVVRNDPEPETPAGPEEI